MSLTLLITTSISYLFINTKSILLVPNLTCNFREEVYLKDFIYKLDGTLQNNYKIDTNTVGKKNLKAVYKDKHGFYKVKTFAIEIKDVTPPTILVNEEYTVTKGYTKKIENEILCADDYDNDITCNLTGSYNLDEVGSYPLTLTATDNSNNITTKDFTLNVIEENSNEDKTEKESFVSYEDIYKKYKTDNTLIGVDISRWQKEVDFKKLKENNVEFVILKVGVQSKINGKIKLDPNFKTNIENALKENLKVGVYFYSYAKTTKEAKTQANFVIKNIKDYNIELPIAFDWENWTNYNEFNISFNSLNNIAKAFNTEIEKNGYKSLLYSSEYYLNTIWFSEDYNNIWLANYGKVTYQGKYDLWQLCSDGKVEGIDTYVDIDIMYLK